MGKSGQKQFARAIYNSGLVFEAGEILNELEQVAATFKNEFMTKSGWPEEKFNLAKGIFAASGRSIIRIANEAVDADGKVNTENRGGQICLNKIWNRIGSDSDKITISELAEFAREAPEGYESCCKFLDLE